MNKTDFESGLDKSIQQTFDLEAEINTNTNKLYFDTFIKLLEGRNIKRKKYEPKIFGSWFIQVNKARIVLDGHESELRIESKKLFSRQKWVEKQSHDLRTRLKLSDMKMMINEIK
jgi:predicted flavoprotein YhiN